MLMGGRVGVRAGAGSFSNGLSGAGRLPCAPGLVD
jgi:hypothetical protein